MAWKYVGPEWYARDKEQTAELTIETQWPNIESKKYTLNRDDEDFVGGIHIHEDSKRMSLYMSDFWRAFSRQPEKYTTEAARLALFNYVLDGLIEIQIHKRLFHPGIFATDIEWYRSRGTPLAFTPPTDDEIKAYQEQWAASLRS